MSPNSYRNDLAERMEKRLKLAREGHELPRCLTLEQFEWREILSALREESRDAPEERKMAEPMGGYAFPHGDFVDRAGMSLRDYFAAKCVAAMLADPNFKDMDIFIKCAPKQAYAVADAMLKERIK